MKKQILFLGIVALMTLAGCRKEEVIPPQTFCTDAASCVALPDDVLYLAANGTGVNSNPMTLGTCWIERWLAYDPFHILRQRVRITKDCRNCDSKSFPDETWFRVEAYGKPIPEGKPQILANLRRALSLGLCGI